MRVSILVPVFLFVAQSFLSAQPILTDEQMRLIEAKRETERGFLTFADGDVSVAELSVDINSREESRQFFNSVFQASENVPIEWTGDYRILDNDVAAAGDTSTAFKEATLLRVNFYRALVGLPGDVVFLQSLNAISQLSALTMSGNDTITHDPKDDDTFDINPFGPLPNYLNDSADEAAGAGNLAIGQYGPDSITGYIEDAGVDNAAAGHRRWILYPPSTVMGTGDAPGGSPPEVPQSIIDNINNSQIGQLTGQRVRIRRANTLHVMDNTNFNNPRPPSDLDYVAYPPPGFVSHQLVFPRWSFSIPNANFGLASVTMTRDGAPITVQPETIVNGFGDNTLVWIYDSPNQSADQSNPHEKPNQDTTYSVTISNISNAPQPSYTYSVTVFDPSVPSNDYQISSIIGPAQPSVGQASQYSAQTQGLGIESGIRWRQFDLLETNSTLEGAENGLANWSEFTSDNYNPLFSGNNSFISSGSRSFHLATGDFSTIQTLTLNRSFLIKSNSSISFQSMLRLATDTQFAKVQASIDGGTSWEDVFSQAGLTPQNSGGFPDENLFTTKNVDLSAFEGRSIEMRFAYVHTGGSAFLQTGTSGGWFFDDVRIQNVDELTNIIASDSVVGNDFTFTPTAEGSKSLQSRPVAFGDYPMEWGSVTTVSAVAGNEPLFSRLINVSTRGKVLTGDAIMIAGFVIEGPDPMDVVIRGVGPTLGSFNVEGTIEDPVLRLFREQNLIDENDNWSDNSPDVLSQHFATVGAFGLQNPSTDAAQRTTLSAGPHTAHVFGNNNSTGVAIVEAYDQTYRTNPDSVTRLRNISTRGFVGTGFDVLVAGFVIEGNINQRLLIRCAGPELIDYDVTGVLADPMIQVTNTKTEQLLHTNDDWEQNANLADLISATASIAFPFDAGGTSSALLVDLAPGATYTVTASGADGGTGIALLEVYTIDQ